MSEDINKKMESALQRLMDASETEVVSAHDVGAFLSAKVILERTTDYPNVLKALMKQAYLSGGQAALTSDASDDPGELFEQFYSKLTMGLGD